MPDGPGGDPEAADGSQAIFMLQSSGGYRANPAENLLRGAKVYRYDSNPTSITSAPAASSWTRDPYNISVHDDGLGVAGLWLFQSGTYNLITSASSNCAGGRQDLCPTDKSFSIENLPEGRHDLVAVGVDPVLNGGSGQAFTARVDRSGPDIAFGGTLKANEDQPLPAGSYSLNVTAVDGTNASPESERSGTVDIRVFLDGQPVGSSAGPCPAGSCARSVASSVVTNTIPDQPHLVQVVATDAAGNESTDCFGTNKSVPTSHTTRFTFGQRVDLADLAQTVSANGYGPSVQSMEHGGANTFGAHVFGNVSFLEEVGEYRMIYQEEHGGNEPRIAAITFHGRVPANALGNYATQIDQRWVECPEFFNPTPEPTTEAALYDSAEGDRLYARDIAGLPDDPDAERGTYPSQHWAPFKGLVLTNTVEFCCKNGNSQTRRQFYYTMKWASRDSLDDFAQDPGLDYAYEHDFKLYSPDGYIGGRQPNCHEQDHYWAEHVGLTLDSNFEENTHPNIDTIIDDHCSSLDFTVGMEYPRNDYPDKLYYAKVFAQRGGKPKGGYQLAGQKMRRVCSGDWRYCSVDSSKTQLMVGASKGDVPECRVWRKGRISKKC